MPPISLNHRSRSPEYALLGFLYSQPGHGYDLHQQLVSELGEVWHISQSQTYSILKRLETRGLISSTLVEQEKHPDLQLLKITRLGRERFRKWLATPNGKSVRSNRLEFITRLYFANRLVPDRLGTMITNQAKDIQATLSHLQAKLGSVPADQVSNTLSLQLRIRQLQLVLAWLEDCRKVFHVKN